MKIAVMMAGGFMTNIIPAEIIENRIYLIRGQKVMFDTDLAKLYSVTTKRLNEQVKRNLDRFPSDFMFQLTENEMSKLRSHFATSKRGGRRYRPFVFTEHGVAMLSTVLNSKKAIQVNILIMRTFAKLRQILSTHKSLSIKLKELEQKYEKHDEAIHAVFEAIRQLMEPPKELPKRRIGFLADRD